jgi:hypothetical protein
MKTLAPSRVILAYPIYMIERHIDASAGRYIGMISKESELGDQERGFRSLLVLNITNTSSPPGTDSEGSSHYLCR